VTGWRRVRDGTEAGAWPALHEVLLAELDPSWAIPDQPTGTAPSTRSKTASAARRVHPGRIHPRHAVEPEDEQPIGEQPRRPPVTNPTSIPSLQKHRLDGISCHD
jgi:hypothetical protein